MWPQDLQFLRTQYNVTMESVEEREELPLFIPFLMSPVGAEQLAQIVRIEVATLQQWSRAEQCTVVRHAGLCGGAVGRECRLAAVQLCLGQIQSSPRLPDVRRRGGLRVIFNVQAEETCGGLALGLQSNG